MTLLVAGAHEVGASGETQCFFWRTRLAAAIEKLFMDSLKPSPEMLEKRGKMAKNSLFRINSETIKDPIKRERFIEARNRIQGLINNTITLELQKFLNDKCRCPAMSPCIDELRDVVRRLIDTINTELGSGDLAGLNIHLPPNRISSGLEAFITAASTTKRRSGGGAADAVELAA